MNNNIYESAKLTFVDHVDPDKFIKLDSNIPQLKKLHSLLENYMKIVVIYGEPGTGKTIFLKKLLYDRKDDPDIIAFFQPSFTLDEFKKNFSRKLFQSEEKDIFDAIHNLNRIKTVILDEVQLYSSDILEYIRILSDTQKLRFILAMHLNKNEELMAKQHFESRITQSIKMELPTKEELFVFIQKKLISSNLAELAQAFNPKIVQTIYQFTNGNLRKTNKFLYTLFDILDYFEKTQPTLLNGKLIDKKFIEMSAIYLGYINA